MKTLTVLKTNSQEKETSVLFPQMKKKIKYMHQKKRKGKR
jgi:hypothetical protein